MDTKPAVAATAEKPASPAPQPDRLTRRAGRPARAAADAHPDAQSSASGSGPARAGAAQADPPAPRRLLDQLRDTIRARHYSIRTEAAYVDWARRYIRFHGRRHPRDMGAAEVGAFLTHLAAERNVGASTQAQARSALLFLYAQVPGIVGIKEASGNIERAARLIKHAPPGFSIYSGDDPTAIALMLLGGRGNVSVTANVAPKAMHELCFAARAGRVAEASGINMRLLELHGALFVEPSPAPTKWALERLGRCGSSLRLPITPLTPAGQALVEAALAGSGLLAGRES